MKLIKNGLVLIVVVTMFSTISGCVDDNSTDSDGDGLTDVSERIAQTNPFDVDTDHDGVWDSKDSNPCYPGILIDSKQKLERSDLYSTDIGIPKGSTLKYYKCGIDIGYASYRFYENYEINASYSQVLDFFLENMIHDGWRSSSSADEIKHIHGIYGMSMYYSKEWLDQPQYVTILVIGQDDGKRPYTQFTIIVDQID